MAENPRFSRSFSFSGRKKLVEEKLDLNKQEETLQDLIKQVKDRKKYSTLEKFMFWKQMGQDPDDVEKIEFDLKNKYYWVHPKAYVWKDQIIFLLWCHTRENKDKGIKERKYIMEITSNEGESYFVGDVKNDTGPDSWQFQVENMLYIVHRVKQNKALQVITFDILSKEHKIYDLKTKNSYDHIRSQYLLEYQGSVIVWFSGKIESKEEKWSWEILTLDGKSLYQEETLERNLDPDFLQKGQYVYFYQFEGGKRGVEGIELKKFDMITNELHSERKEEFESKLKDIMDHGYIPGKFPDTYEFKNVTSYQFIRQLGETRNVPIEETFVMLELYDKDTDQRFCSLRRVKKPNDHLSLLRFKSETHRFTYGQVANQYYIAYSKNGKIDVSWFESDVRAKGDFQEVDDCEAKVLIHYDKPVAQFAEEGKEDLIQECINKAKEQLYDECIILVQADNNRNNEDRKQYFTFVIKTNDEIGNKWMDEGREGWLQQYKRRDPESVWQFEHMQIKPTRIGWSTGLRYMLIKENQDGEIVSETFQRDYPNHEGHKGKTTPQFFMHKLMNDRDGHPPNISVIEDRINQKVIIIHPWTPTNKPDYNQMIRHEYEYDYENDEVQDIKCSTQEPRITREQDKDEEKELQIEHFKIILKEKEDSPGLKYIEIQWSETPDSEPKKKILETFMNIQNFVQSRKESYNRLTDSYDIYIQVYSAMKYIALIKDYKISYKKNGSDDQLSELETYTNSSSDDDVNGDVKFTLEPNIEMIGCKYIQTGRWSMEPYKIHEKKLPDQDFITSLVSSDTGRELVIQRPEDIEYKFEAFGLQSTFYFYENNGCRQYFVIDITFKNEKEATKLQADLSDNQLDSVYCQLINVMLNMKPKQSLFDYWMDNERIFQIDVFQHREDLNGLSYASVLTMEPKYFEKLVKIENEDVHFTQKSLVTYFKHLSGRPRHQVNEKIKEAFMDQIPKRKVKDISVGIDFKSPAQHCLYIKQQDMSVCASVLSQIISRLKNRQSEFNKLSIQMLIPSIMNHPEGKVVDETSTLFVQYEQEAKVSSFFDELHHDLLPLYFGFEQNIICKQDFNVVHPNDKGKDSNGQDRYQNKERQSVEEVKKTLEDGGAQDKFSRTYTMNKDFFNTNIILRKHSKPDLLLFNYDTFYDEYETGKLLNKIIQQYGQEIEYLNNVRAMIDYKFDRHTKGYFMKQQLLFILLCFVPFMTLVELERDSGYIIPLLILSEAGQLLFFTLELVNLIDEGPTSYFGDPSNFADYCLFLLHTVFAVLKLFDYWNAIHEDETTPLSLKSVHNHKAKPTTDIDGHTSLHDPDDYLQNIIIVLICFIFLAIVGKLQHLIKVYREYGRLTVLISKSITKVIPFMVIFLVWTSLFAMMFLVLRSCEEDADDFKGLSTEMGYIFLAFENGIGNIKSPKVDNWLSEFQKPTAKAIVWMIYVTWFLNQFILLTVLLNFVIALISEVFEMVMDHKMVHEYAQKQQLNDEDDRYRKFLDRIKGALTNDDEVVNQVILISSEKKVVDDEEWKGLIQTFKKFMYDKVVAKFNILNKDIQKDQQIIKDDVKLVEKTQNLGIDAIRKDMKSLTDLCEVLQKDQKTLTSKIGTLKENKQLKEDMLTMMQNIANNGSIDDERTLSTVENEHETPLKASRIELSDFVSLNSSQPE